jgi:transcriptional regulator with XRE-family HTH domain
MSADDLGAHKQSLALTLRRLRTERQLSQAELATATGISSSFLSLVEQGRSDVTIGRLLRLAEFYDLELIDLLGRRDPNADPVHVLRADPENMIHSEAEGVDVFDLGAGSRSVLVPTLSVYQPGGEVEINHAHEYDAMLFVLDGTFEIEIPNREPVRLRRGEGATHRNITSYRVRNVSKRTGRALGITLRHQTSYASGTEYTTGR